MKDYCKQDFLKNPKEVSHETKPVSAPISAPVSSKEEYDPDIEWENGGYLIS